MQHKLKHVVLVIFCALANISSLHAQTLVLTTEDYPPFNIADPKNEEVSGISTDKVRELMRRAGETYSLRAYPWARAFQMAQQNTNTCVFSTTRTPEREPMFKWVGPLVKNNWVVFARADDHRHPKNLEELRPYVLGAYRKDAVGEFLITKGFKIELANVDADNPRKLLYRRFDFWATGELLGLSILKQQNLIGQIVPLFQFQQTELYLACHPDVPQQRIDLFNQLLLEMEKDGTVKAIEKRYQ